VAKRYIALESLRLSDRLTVEWGVEPGTERAAVPPFSLQTLLENAIKHGISPKEEGGSITVRIEERDELLQISVKDDGMGTDVMRVEEAQGKGLHLLQRRVATLFGEAASLTWSTAPGQGFLAILMLPLMEARAMAPGQALFETSTDSS